MKLVDFPGPQKRVSGGNGGGSGDQDARLRVLEGDVRAVQEKLAHVALREDVLKLKLWVLGGVIGGMVIAVSLGIAIARLFLLGATN